MTCFIESVVLLSFILATSAWLGVVGFTSPGGRLNDGNALQLFLAATGFNATSTGFKFDPSDVCKSNQTRIKCDDSNLNVVSLDLSNMNLMGPIPKGSIGNLSWLGHLDLSLNHLNGSVAEDFVRLSNLTFLNLSRNSIGGSFPPFVGNLSALRQVDFSVNLMNGTVPDLSQHTDLSVVRLNRNYFKGYLPEKFPPRLTELDLTSNDIYGSIPLAMFNLRSLRSLKLANNNLTGSVSAFASATLEFLDLSDNFFTGNIPNLTNQLHLNVLDLHQNNFNGKIQLPTSFAANLSVFDVHGNQLEGNVTELIDTLKPAGSVLTTLDLSSNQFSRQNFPSDFSLFTKLTTLGLADIKFFDHPFPALPSAALARLNLSSTNLSQNIPPTIGTLGMPLVFLDLSRNNLVGGIPSEIGKLSQLELLDLSGNNLSGSIPAILANLTFLSSFNVSDNNLRGAIPLGAQFDTFPNSSYAPGNLGLCGPPLLAKCEESRNNSSYGKKKSTTSGPIIAGLVTGILVILIVGAALFIWCRVSRAVKPLGKDETKHVSGPMQFEKDAESWASGIKDSSGITVVMFEKPLLNLSFADLLQATANFSKELQIADGGYGPVYKGVLPDNTQLAIKVLVEVGFADEKKAAARIEGLAKVKHANLVPLIGYCLVGEDSVLIYEYMVNGDLQRWLHELPEGTRNPEDWSRDTWEQLEGVEISGEYLNWPTRHKIALGTARGLAFLHHGCSPHVIHRDVKSSNILLDDAFDPHLVDSGLAGIARTNGTPIIGGTLGYVPPEYGQTWQATTRGDVYSFGVVLLELVTGRKPTGHFFHDSYGGNLVGWVRSMIKLDKRGQKALDPKLVSRGYVPEMLETLRIGYLCTAETPAKRPTMQQVVGLLKDCQSGLMT